MIRRPPRSTLSSSSAASDVFKRQVRGPGEPRGTPDRGGRAGHRALGRRDGRAARGRRPVPAHRAGRARRRRPRPGPAVPAGGQPVGSMSWGPWLDPATSDPDTVLDLLHDPAPSLVASPVSTEVNTVGTDGPQLIEPTG